MGGETFPGNGHPADCLCPTCAISREYNAKTAPKPNESYPSRKIVNSDGWVDIIQGPPS
jgi:hypothetical protein